MLVEIVDTIASALPLNSDYARGCCHTIVILVPIVFVLVKWFSRNQTSFMAEEIRNSPFLHELHLLEVLLVSGAEMKTAKDKVVASPTDKVLNERLMKIANLVHVRLEKFTPLIQFLTTETVSILRGVDSVQDKKHQ